MVEDDEEDGDAADEVDAGVAGGGRGVGWRRGGHGWDFSRVVGGCPMGGWVGFALPVR